MNIFKILFHSGRCDPIPILNGTRRETVRGRLQSRTSIEMFEEAI